MPTQHKDIRSERIQIYFDCICGIICSAFCLTGIFIVVPQVGILHPTAFMIGLTFLLGYLALSFFMIGLGIYTYYREKSFNADEIPKKKLRTPIV